MKLGKVGVGTGGAAGGIGLGGGAVWAVGLINSSAIMTIKTIKTNPARTPITSACERVTHRLPSSFHFTLKTSTRKTGKSEKHEGKYHQSG
jgi:hypothetical protein